MTAKDLRSVWTGASSRPCLCCRKTFASAGAHERICRDCKESEEWRAGAAEFPVAAAETRATGE